MALIKGRTIQRYELDTTKKDAFGVPEGSYTSEDIDNVLIGSPSESEVLENIQIHGKQITYTLAIPIGDEHDWSSGTIVGFYGRFWQTIGAPVRYDENALNVLPAAVPWNTKVRVTAYDGDVETEAADE